MVEKTLLNAVGGPQYSSLIKAGEDVATTQLEFLKKFSPFPVKPNSGGNDS